MKDGDANLAWTTFRGESGLPLPVDMPEKCMLRAFLMVGIPGSSINSSEFMACFTGRSVWRSRVFFVAVSAETRAERKLDIELDSSRDAMVGVGEAFRRGAADEPFFNPRSELSLGNSPVEGLDSIELLSVDSDASQDDELVLVDLVSG